MFKFKESAQARERERVFAGLREQGASTVEPLFPGVEDDELASVFMLSAEDESGERLLKRLKRDEAVEYAEPEVQRKLAS